MIKVLKIRAIAGLRYTADIFADTKAEVSDNSHVVGLEKNAHIDIGSTLVTADGHIAFRNSSGEWVWQDEDEDSTDVTPSVSNSAPKTISRKSISIEEPNTSSYDYDAIPTEELNVKGDTK